MNFFKLKILIIAFTVVSILPACGVDGNKPLKTYKYKKNEAVFQVAIEKMEIYDNMVQLTFENDSLSNVEYVYCYGKDFSTVEENPVIEFQDNILTIKTEKGEQISGLKVCQNSDYYFNVRYLDSETYAILVYSFVYDVGYVVYGDEDAYYTQEEKEEQEIQAEAEAEAEAYAYNYVMGTWVNENETIRLEFDSTEEGREYHVYEKVANQWKLCQTIPVKDITGRDTSDGFELELYNSLSWGALYSFLIYDNGSKMQSHYFSDYFSDDTFTRVEE